MFESCEIIRSRNELCVSVQIQPSFDSAVLGFGNWTKVNDFFFVDVWKM